MSVLDFKETAFYKRAISLGDNLIEVPFSQRYGDTVLVSMIPFKPSEDGSTVPEIVSKNLIDPAYKDFATISIIPFLSQKGTYPTDEEIEEFIPYVKSKLEFYDNVVLFGKNVASSFIPSDYTKGKMFSKVIQASPYSFENKRYIVNYAPGFVLSEGGENSSIYEQFVDAFTQISFEYVEPTVEITVTALSEIDNHIQYFLETDQDVACDYEATSLNPWEEDFRVIGLSFSTLDKATYFDFDIPFNDHHRELLLRIMTRDGKEPWVYNVGYESKVIWKTLLSKDFLKLNDVFVLAKIDSRIESLKNVARSVLKAPMWESELSVLVKLFTTQLELLGNIRESGLMLYGGEWIGESNTTKTKGWISHFNETQSKILELITPDEYGRGLSKLSPWEAVPPRIIGQYCCEDSYWTIRLKHHYWDQYKEFYPYYIVQSWLGSVMESYGMNWSEDKAEELDEFYIQEGIHNLCEIIRLGKFDLEYSKFDKDTAMLEMQAIINDDIPSAKKLAELKTIFNPMSNKYESQLVFWNAFKTDWTLNCNMLYRIETGILGNNFLSDDLIQHIDKTSVENTLMTLLSVVTEKRPLGELHGIIADLEGSPYKGFASAVFEYHYAAFTKYGNLHPDCPDGGAPPGLKEGDKGYKIYDKWTDEFRLLYHLRKFKKVAKSRSSYINGKVGRGKVSLARVDDFMQPPVRIAHIDQVPLDYKLKPNELFLMNTDFFVNGADTRRWRSAIHTVPWNCELREIYTPRAWNSMVCHYDYSAMEVRVLAKVANDANLMAAFERGVDIHKYVASRVWKCEESEVTDSMRRYAKMSTFSILYGKSIEAFADEMLGGDLKGAYQLFDDFFTAFPGIKDYIEAKHAEVRATGRVTTMFGDPLLIGPGGLDTPNSELRAAQNYPIQSSASTLAAVGIWNTYEEFKRKNLRAIPVGFTHDASDIEFIVDDLFEVQDTVRAIAVDRVKEELGVPVAIDMEYGIHQDSMMEMDLIRQTDNSRTYNFKCPLHTLDPIIQRLSIGFEVAHEVGSTSDKYNSLMELFITRRAFSRYLGSKIEIGKGEITLTRKY